MSLQWDWESGLCLGLGAGRSIFLSAVEISMIEKWFIFFSLQETAESQGISAMPTFIFYRDGKKVQSHSRTLDHKVESLGMRLMWLLCSCILLQVH